jgi:hypothetical protein
LYQRLKAYVAIDLEAATLVGVDVAPVRMRYCSKNEAGFLPVLPPISGFAKSTAHAKILRSPRHSHSIVSGTYKHLKLLIFS